MFHLRKSDLPSPGRPYRGSGQYLARGRLRSRVPEAPTESASGRDLRGTGEKSVFRLGLSCIVRLGCASRPALSSQTAITSTRSGGAARGFCTLWPPPSPGIDRVLRASQDLFGYRCLERGHHSWHCEHAPGYCHSHVSLGAVLLNRVWRLVDATSKFPSKSIVYSMFVPEDRLQNDRSYAHNTRQKQFNTAPGSRIRPE